MEFSYSEKQLEIKAMLRDFAEKEIVPILDKMDRDAEYPLETVKKLGKMGIMGMPFPEEYGGAGLDYVTYVMAVEEISKICPSHGVIVQTHNALCCWPIFAYGTEEQKRKYLPSLLSGEKIGAFGLTEPNAGTDAAMQQTIAEDKGDHYVLNGSKVFISGGGIADVYVIMAMTDQSKGTKGISAFIVEKGTPGFSCARKLDKFGMRGSNTGELILENVFVPKENVLGQVGQGVYVLMSGLDYERLVLSAGPIGLMRAALDEVLPYVHQRKQFGQPIAHFQLMQGKLADMYTKMAASRAYTYETARAADAGTLKSMDSSGAILYAAERATEVCLEAIQAMGGMGYMNETSVGRLLRDAKLYEIGAGTSEVRRIVIGRAFNKEYKQ